MCSTSGIAHDAHRAIPSMGRAKNPTALAKSRLPATADEPRSRYRSLTDPASLREFAKNLGEGIYITTPDGRILDANPAFLEMFGVQSIDAFAGMSAYDLFADPKRREDELQVLMRD